MNVRSIGLLAAISVINLIPSLSHAADHSFSSAASQIVTQGIQAVSAAGKCAERVKEAGCHLSNNDVGRIKANVQECKKLTSNSGNTRLEVFLLKNSDKLVVYQTKGTNIPGPNKVCPVTKYTVDNSGIKDILIRGNKTWMISNDGALYLMMPDQSVSEVMNSSGNSYTGITQIKGLADVESLHIIGKTFDTQLTGDKLAKRARRPLHFVRYNSLESLFNDH